MRYVELNPVRAGLVSNAAHYPWSSAKYHASLCVDELLTNPRPFPGREPDWNAFLSQGLSISEMERIRMDTATGRPTGSKAFVKRLEEQKSRT